MEGTSRTRRFNLRGRTLRQHAARGALINSGFMVGLSFMGFIRGFILAGLLTATDYGLWGIVVVALNITAQLKAAGIGDKYVQQDEDDQELAFQKAFTLEALLSGITLVLMLATIPLFVLLYDEPRMFWPAVIVSGNLIAGVIQMPIWVHYRQMEFFKQRVIQSIDPVVSFVVMIVLAAAGAGYWALFVGVTVGAWVMAIVAVVTSPYKLRLRYDRGTLRSYVHFSGPLLMAAMGGVVIAQAALFATDAHLGLAAVGALTLASTITEFTNRVDQLITGTLYPAICAVRDRTELLYESFVKSNRIGLMWAMPFGIGLSLFCADLVQFAIGKRWEPAVPLLQTFGIIAAVGSIGFNWDAYFRARGETKPMAVAAAAAMVSFLAALPLLFLYDLDGLAMAVAIQTVVHLACRAYYLRRLFDGFAFLPHATRSMVPAIPPALVVLALRQLEGGERTVAMALGEIALFCALTAVLTWAFERRLLVEAVGYLRSRPAATSA